MSIEWLEEVELILARKVDVQSNRERCSESVLKLYQKFS